MVIAAGREEKTTAAATRGAKASDPRQAEEEKKVEQAEEEKSDNDEAEMAHGEARHSSDVRLTLSVSRLYLSDSFASSVSLKLHRRTGRRTPTSWSSPQRARVGGLW
jgi:hypothetical protein